MSITLNKPLGTDIYDINVFNQNSTIIEQYLNNFQSNFNNSIYIYYYPGYSSVIDIDNLVAGFHICDDLLIENLKGTYPNDDSKVNFEILSFGKDETSKLQIYVDMSYSHNKLYIRSWTKTENNWTEWKSISEGSTSGDLNIEYIDSYNINNLNSGIYFIKNPTGDLPETITENIQITSYGETGKSKTQTLIDINNNNLYHRIYDADSDSWSIWKQDNENEIEVSVVNL